MKITLWVFALSSLYFGRALELLNEKSFVAKVRQMLESHGGKVAIDESFGDDAAKRIWERFSSNKILDGGIKFGVGRLDRSKKERRSMAASDYWTSDEMNYLLNKHNNYRGNTSEGLVADDGTDGKYPTSANMNSVFWDDALASVAQNHSETCIYRHNSNRNTQFYNYKQYARFAYPSSKIYMGENIAAMTSSATLPTLEVLQTLADLWFDEHTDWHYQAYASSSINGAGHFTQLVWAATRYIGCGFAICDESGATMHYLVCDYYPGGNYVGDVPYITGTNYAECDPDRTAHANGLCAGCMSSYYVLNGSTTANDCGKTSTTARPTSTTELKGSKSSQLRAVVEWKFSVALLLVLGLINM